MWEVYIYREDSYQLFSSNPVYTVHDNTYDNQDTQADSLLPKKGPDTQDKFRFFHQCLSVYIV